MFDPKLIMDKRLVAELSVDADKFYPKRDCDEQELKYLLSSESFSPFENIRHSLQRCKNRTVDTRFWERNKYSLVTLNLDTVDQKLADAGFSLRVRFALGEDAKVQNVDMCLKTSLPTAIGTDNIAVSRTRGEWEIELPNLKPNINRLIAEHRRSNPAIPDAFIALNIANKDLFVETIGITQRNIFPSYERFERNGRKLVSAFQHTEDNNIFLSPLGELTGSDREAEAEFLGIYGINEGDIPSYKFKSRMNKAMELLDRKIRTADNSLVTNDSSKAVRSRVYLERLYGPCSNIAVDFTKAARIAKSSEYALSYKIGPEDMTLSDLLRQAAPIRAQSARLSIPQGNPFQFAKYA